MAMQQIGSVVQFPGQAMAPETPSTKPRPISGLPATDGECRELLEWAESLPADRQPLASQAQILRHIDFMEATLPSQNADDDKGRKKIAVYVSLLSEFSDEALRYMARTACQTLKWFPVPAQCLDLARAYRPPVGEREATLRICHDFAQGAFERWLVNVSEGQPIGDVPEQWLRIAVERGPLRRLANGSFVSRALYHGPVKPVLSLVAA